ncbi:hypothetical protein V6N11_080243 [Hibiscus sabdariffa]|uniref:Uncharacterized protein n=1 Tax=Hibiscus sabdariffa TaxID=183260 RepID=A0ABR2R7G7_9ROSI
MSDGAVMNSMGDVKFKPFPPHAKTQQQVSLFAFGRLDIRINVLLPASGTSVVQSTHSAMVLPKSMLDTEQALSRSWNTEVSDAILSRSYDAP